MTAARGLQIIQNCEIGGAQRSASVLAKHWKDWGRIVTFDRLGEVESSTFEAILLHSWCTRKGEEFVNWPNAELAHAGRLVVFHHDWHGDLNFGADEYIVYSCFAKRHCVADAAVRVVPGGIDVARFQQIVRPKGVQGAVVGRLSTLFEGKITVETVRFWSSIPAARFVIGGSGPQLDSLRAEFASDPRYSFPGAVRPRDVPRFLAGIDVFLYDTSWHCESFCYVVLEAMAAGCVVIAKARGAIPELVEHGHNGFLYLNDDEAIEYARSLVADVGWRRLVASRAAKFAAGYSNARFVENVTGVIRSNQSELE